MSNNNELLSIANTLTANWLELRLAEFLGKKIETVDSVGMKVTQTLYKGRLYFLGYEDTRDKLANQRNQK